MAGSKSPIKDDDGVLELDDNGVPVKFVRYDDMKTQYSYLVIPRDKFCNPKPDVGGWKWK